MSYLIQYEPDFQGNSEEWADDACVNIQRLELAAKNLKAQVKALEKKVKRAELRAAGVTLPTPSRSTRWGGLAPASWLIPAITGLEGRGYSLTVRKEQGGGSSFLYSLRCPPGLGLWDALGAWEDLYFMAGIWPQKKIANSYHTQKPYTQSRRPDGSSVVTFIRSPKPREEVEVAPISD